MQTIDAEGEFFRANSDHDLKDFGHFGQPRVWQTGKLHRNRHSLHKHLARQEFLHELTQFAKFKQNQAPSPSQSTAVASFVFLAKMKQFCKHFLKFCTQNIISEVNNNATINENEKVDLGKANFWNSMDEYVLLTNQEEHLQSLDAAKLLQFKLKQIETLLRFLSENLFKLAAILYASDAKSSQN